MNRVKSLLKMRGLLLGYSFEPSSNSRALAIGSAGSIETTLFSINGYLHWKNQFVERRQD